MNAPKFTKHGTAAGANAYKSEDGRFYLSSAMTTQNTNVRAMRHRVWTVVDHTQRDACCPRYPRTVASGNTLAACKARLAKYLAAEGA